MTRFVLSSDHINELVIASIREMIAKAKWTGTVDVVFRVNGEEQHYECDWLKYLAEEQ